MPRTRAARAIAAVIGNGITLDEALDRSTGPLTGRDRALAREIAFGVCRRYFELDALLAQLMERPLKSRDADVRALLLVGLYQLRHMRVPDHAAVSETVAASKQLDKPWARGLVNAVLRAYQARVEQLDAALTPAQRVAHPPWLVQALERAWPAQLADILAANNAAPPMTLRVNAARTTREAWLATAREAGIEARACAFAADGVVLAEAARCHAAPRLRRGPGQRAGRRRAARRTAARQQRRRAYPRCLCRARRQGLPPAGAPCRHHAGRARQQRAAPGARAAEPAAPATRGHARVRRCRRPGRVVGRQSIRPHPGGCALLRHRRDPSPSRHPHPAHRGADKGGRGAAAGDTARPVAMPEARRHPALQHLLGAAAGERSHDRGIPRRDAGCAGRAARHGLRHRARPRPPAPAHGRASTTAFSTRACASPALLPPLPEQRQPS